MIFIPISGIELLKLLGFPQVMRAIKESLVMLMRWLLESNYGWELIANQAKEGAGSWIHHQQPMSSSFMPA